MCDKVSSDESRSVAKKEALLGKVILPELPKVLDLPSKLSICVYLFSAFVWLYLIKDILFLAVAMIKTRFFVLYSTLIRLIVFLLSLFGVFSWVIVFQSLIFIPSA